MSNTCIRLLRAVGDVDVAVQVNRDAVRRAELARFRAWYLAADLLHEAAVLVELHDAVVHVAVGDEDVALRIPRDVGWPAERVAGAAAAGGRRRGSHAEDGWRPAAERPS